MCNAKNRMTVRSSGQYPICPPLTEVPDSLAASGREAFAGFSLRVVSRTASTQDLVMRAATQGARAGYCVVALEQAAGRGRQGRTWVGKAGHSLLLSLLAGCPQPHLTAIPLATGLALTDGLHELGIDARIKWPNDVLAGGGKLAGILCEAVPRSAAVVVGIGINLAPVSGDGEFAASSLLELGGRSFCWQEVLEVLLPHLRRRWDQAATSGVAEFRNDWLSAATGIGETITADVAGEWVTGVAEDIDDTGSLLVKTVGGVIRLLAAEGHLGSPRR